MTEQFANEPVVPIHLAAGIDNAQTAIPLDSGAALPATGTYRVLVENEIMKVTARAVNTLTVVRGQEGTAAAAHAGGVEVDPILTAAALAQFKADILAAAGSDTVVFAADADNTVADGVSTTVIFTGLTANRTNHLAVNPTVGQIVKTGDGDGSLAAHSITIDGNGHNIDGAGTYVMTSVQDGARAVITAEYVGGSVGWKIL